MNDAEQVEDHVLETNDITQMEERILSRMEENQRAASNTIGEQHSNPRQQQFRPLSQRELKEQTESHE